MSNLIPEAMRQKIRAEYRARFILAGSFLTIGVALFTVLVLSPSYGSLLISRPAAAAQATQAQENKTDSADIARAQSLVAQIGPVITASSTVSTAILQALSDKPAGVHIDNIAYTFGGDANIALGGSADNREAVDKFRTTLLADSHFTSVKLPVGDLVGGEGGRFTVTLTGNF